MASILKRSLIRARIEDTDGQTALQVVGDPDHQILNNALLKRYGGNDYYDR